MINLKKLFAKMYSFWLNKLIKINRKCKPKKSDYYETTKKMMNLHVNDIFSEKDFCKSKNIARDYDTNDIDLSFIIPVYNTERYLSECIDSIVNQKTKFKFEIILVNNSSTDNSIDIINNYHNRFPHMITVVNLPINNGPGAGKNAGINCSSGKYLSFVDSDDILYEGFVETFMNKAITSNCDIVKGGYEQFDSQGNIRYRKMFYNEIIDNPKTLADEIISIDCFVWGSIIKRSFFEKVRFPVGYPEIIDDRIMKLFIYSQVNNLCYIDMIGYRYRLNLNGTTLSKKSFGLFYNQIVFYIDSIYKYDNLKLEKNDLFKNIIMYEFGFFIYFSSLKIKKNIKKKIFYQICNFINDYNFYSDNYDEMNSMYYDCFINYDYIKWKNLYQYRRITNYLNK